MTQPVESAATQPPSGAEGLSPRRVAINTVSNWVAMVVQVAANLFLIGYVLRYLTEELFGIYRLAITVSVAVGLLAFGMSASVLRLASEGVASRRWDHLADVLSVARTLFAGAALAGLVVVAVIALLFQDLLKVPAEHQFEAAILFGMTGLASAIDLLTTVYGGAIRANQRYDLANGIIVVQMAIQVALVVIAFQGGWVSLRVLGVSRLIVSAIALAWSAAIMRRLLPQVRLSVRRWTRAAVGDVLSFGLWTAVKMTARVGLEQAAVPIASATLGVATVAALAIPQLVSQYLMQIVTGLTTTLWPVAARFSVEGRRGSLARLYRVSTRVAMLMLVPAVAVLATHGRPFIRGLKPQLEWTYNVVLVYMGLFLVRGAMLPADHIILASGSIRAVAISQVIAAAVGIPAGLAVALWTDWGLYGIVTALFIPAVVQSVAYLPYQIRRETGVGLRETFLGCLWGPVAGAIVPLTLGAAMAKFWPPVGLFWTMVQMALCGLAYLAAAWALVLRADERELVLRVVRRRGGAK